MEQKDQEKRLPDAPYAGRKSKENMRAVGRIEPRTSPTKKPSTPSPVVLGT